MKNRNTVRKNFIFLSFFLIDFLIALGATDTNLITPKAAEFFAVPKNLIPWITNSYLCTIFLATFVFLLVGDVFRKREGIRKFFTEGVVYFLVGSAICYFANNFGLFIFGRIVQGLGAGIVLLAQVRLAKFLSTQNLRTMSLFIAAGIVAGIVAGNHIPIPEIFSRDFRFIFALTILGSAISLLAVSEFFIRWQKRFATWGIGHTADAIFSYAFDFILYPFVIWKLGLLKGLLVMFPLSFLICWANLIFYDWLKKDYLAIETLKEMREYQGSNFVRKLFSALLHKGGIPAFVFLSLNFDPFITTVYMRRGAHKYEGLSRRDWAIFLASVFVGNAYWALVAFGIVSAFRFAL